MPSSSKLVNSASGSVTTSFSIALVSKRCSAGLARFSPFSSSPGPPSSAPSSSSSCMARSIFAGELKDRSARVAIGDDAGSAGSADMAMAGEGAQGTRGLGTTQGPLTGRGARRTGASRGTPGMVMRALRSLRRVTPSLLSVLMAAFL